VGILEERGISPLSGFDPRTVQPVASRYTDHRSSIPTELSRLSRPIGYFSHYTTNNRHITVHMIYIYAVGVVLLLLAGVATGSGRSSVRVERRFVDRQRILIKNKYNIQ
jgi:hypothetical protein